jgi:hypothetical protein
VFFAQSIEIIGHLERNRVDDEGPLGALWEAEDVRITVDPGIEIEIGRDLADELEPNGTAETGDRLTHPGDGLLAVGYAGEIGRGVGDLAGGDPDPSAGEAALREVGHDHAPMAGLTEAKRVGVARVGVALSVRGGMEVTEERVVDVGPLDVDCVEGRMGFLVGPLKGQRRAVGCVREGEVSGGGEPTRTREEIGRAAWRAVSCAPEDEALGELERAQRTLFEDPDVGGPIEGQIRARGSEPVMIAG